MMKKTIISICTLAIVTAAFPAFCPAAARDAKNDVIVVPARNRMIALAFDVQALRDVVMISYKGTAATADPLLHVWNRKTQQWEELGVQEYSIGQFMPAQPNNLYLIGTDRDLPPSVLSGAAQARSVIRIDTISIAEIVNILNQSMNFSEKEWKALAKRHGLETRDLNYERRKWGRFGAPGTRIAPPKPAVGMVESPEEEIPAVDAAVVDNFGQVENTPVRLKSDTLYEESSTEEPVMAKEPVPPVLSENDNQPLDPDDIAAEAPSVSPDHESDTEAGSVFVPEKGSSIPEQEPTQEISEDLLPEEK